MARYFGKQIIVDKSTTQQTLLKLKTEVLFAFIIIVVRCKRWYGVLYCINYANVKITI